MTTKRTIREWLAEGKRLSATHVLSVSDTYDWEDYPVYVLSSQDVLKTIKDYSSNMQRINEVYNLSLDIEKQLNESRAYNV